MCLEIDGGACAGPADCLNGNCFDNICCESACSGLCQSCLGSETGGMNGVCALVTVNTDPRDDCTDPLVCDNMGACVTPP
ncbi:MAG: hypothetical protein R3F14_07985 [Polyangiaceae bacterium]